MTMSMTKFGRRLKSIGQKVSHAVRSIGQKVSSVAMRAAPALSMINPELGAAAAAVSGIAGGVSRAPGAAEDVLAGRATVSDGVQSVRNQVAAVKTAYGQGRSAVSSALERRR